MTTPYPNVRPPAITEVPQPPTEFGKDRGRFYHYYDSLADEVDDDMTKGLKEQLDGLLIFAGLFAGVNSAFLGLSLPLLSPDATDDTNALLTQNNALLLSTILGRNDSLPTNFTLPSTTFAPSGRVIATNVLFSLSLTFALIASFIAVVGRQWLIYYRKRSGAGPDRQRWDQLRRFLGAKRWRLELVLDDLLPSLLQAGLVVFCIAFALHLRILNFQVSLPVEITLYASLGVFTFSAICTLCDSFCPFQSPLSRLLSLSMHAVLRALSAVAFLLYHLGRFCLWAVCRAYLPVGCLFQLVELCTSFIFCFPLCCLVCHEAVYYCLERLSEVLPFQDTSTTILQGIAAKRVICTSDDPEALLTATTNLLTIDDASSLQLIWTDPLFRNRLVDQCLTAYDRTIEWQGRNNIRLATESARFYRAVLGHFLFSCSSSELETEFMGRIGDVCSQKQRQTHTNWAPADFILISSPSLIDATLAWSLFQIHWTAAPRKAALSRMSMYSEALLQPRWRLLSLVLYGVSGTAGPRDPVVLDMESGVEEAILEPTQKVHMAYNRPYDIAQAFYNAVSDPPSLFINGPDSSARLLENTFTCAVHLVFGARDFGIEFKVRVFRMIELYLRQTGASEGIRRLWISSQSQVVQQLKEGFLTEEWAEYEDARSMRRQIESLLNERRQLLMTEQTRNDNRRLATMLGPLVNGLNVVKVGNVHETAWMESLTTLNRTFHKFQVDNRIRTRDPEQCWCQWQE